MKRICLLCTLINLSLISLNAQDSSLLFAAELGATVQGDAVILHWQDSSEFDQIFYEVWRSREKIDDDFLLKADRIATLGPGYRSFTDYPPAGGEHWYALIALVHGSRPHATPFFRLMTKTALRTYSEAIEENQFMDSPIFDVQIDGDRVLLSYTAKDEGREILFFRSPSPMKVMENFDQSMLLKRSRDKKILYEDRPLPGIPWYYSAVDALLYSLESPSLINEALFSAAVLVPPLSLNRWEDSRDIDPSPWPTLRVEIPPRIQEGRIYDDSTTGISDSARVAMRALSSRIGRTKFHTVEPLILPIDKNQSSSQRQKSLQKILQGSFAAGQWENAGSELLAFSHNNGLSATTRARVYFYLGQCQYYSEEWQSSFLSFLIAQEKYYPETRPWLNRIYEILYSWP